MYHSIKLIDPFVFNFQITLPKNYSAFASSIFHYALYIIIYRPSATRQILYNDEKMKQQSISIIKNLRRYNRYFLAPKLWRTLTGTNDSGFFRLKKKPVSGISVYKLRGGRPRIIHGSIKVTSLGKQALV